MSGSEGSEKVASSVSEDSIAFSSSAFSSGSSGGFFSSMVESSDSGVSSFDSGVSSEVGSEGDDSSASSGCDLPLELQVTRFNPFWSGTVFWNGSKYISAAEPFELEWNAGLMVWILNIAGSDFTGVGDECEPRGVYTQPGTPNWEVDDV